jgi:hypothetical protein
MNKKIMEATGFAAEVNLINRGQCPMCFKLVVLNAFRDAKSEREFIISGLCQDCQDDIWKMKEEIIRLCKVVIGTMEDQVKRLEEPNNGHQP